MIDFEKMDDELMTQFLGGNGTVKGRISNDGKVKIMRAVLEEGVSIGVHTHETSSEVVYVLSGEATFTVEGGTEKVAAGQCHYCPKGGTHGVANLNKEPLVMFCVVPVQ